VCLVRANKMMIHDIYIYITKKLKKLTN